MHQIFDCYWGGFLASLFRKGGSIRGGASAGVDIGELHATSHPGAGSEDGGDIAGGVGPAVIGSRDHPLLHPHVRSVGCRDRHPGRK